MNYNHTKIGLLTTSNSPIIRMLVKHLLINQFTNLNILIDEKKLNTKDLSIWYERTEGKLDSEGISCEKQNQLKIPVYTFENHNNSICLHHIKNAEYDIIINCGTPRKLSKDFINSTKNGIINVHPGILPYYRGSCCVEWSIYNDHKVGNTAHLMSTDYDNGPIILTEIYEISELNNYSDVRVYIFRRGVELTVKALKYLLDNNFSSSVLQFQENGKTYPPIPYNKLEEVKRKIKNSFNGSLPSYD